MLNFEKSVEFYKTLPPNKAIKPCYHVRPDYGRRMRIANFEEVRLTCPICGEKMKDFVSANKWD